MTNHVPSPRHPIPPRELERDELDCVAGGLNPQPLPPRELLLTTCVANSLYARGFQVAF